MTARLTGLRGLTLPDLDAPDVPPPETPAPPTLEEMLEAARREGHAAGLREGQARGRAAEQASREALAEEAIRVALTHIDRAGEVARDIFGGPSHVEYRILSADERITALQRSQVDVVVKTMTITCERRKLVNFSTVYLDANQRILAPRDSPIAKVSDLSGKRVCVARGTTSLRRIREIAPPAVIVSVVNWADCLVAMQQRQIDAVSTDDSILAGLVEEDPYLHIVGPNMATQPYGIGINLDNTGLVRFVNGTLERIRTDGTWNTLYRKWLTVLGPAPLPPQPRYVD